MGSKTSSQKTEGITWQAEQIRLSVFAGAGTTPKLRNWKGLLEKEPDKIQVDRKEDLFVEEGESNGQVLRLIVRPPSINWLVVPPPPPEPHETFLLMGDWQEQLNWFIPLMQNWLSDSVGIVRIGFGSILLSPVDSLIEGYHELIPLLPSVTLYPGESSDFLYQINHPKASQTGVPGLKINRLTKWSVAMQAMGRIDISPIGPGEFKASPKSFACRLELDVNTAQDFEGPLPDKDLNAIFDELVTLAQNIAHRGEEKP